MNGNNDLVNVNNHEKYNIDKQTEKQKEYEELLIRRDHLYKVAGSYMTVYTAEFGDMISSNFEIKIECIKKKKAIGYCQKRINLGIPVDAVAMQNEIEEEMKQYYIQLQEMIDDTENAKKSENVGQYRFDRAKKIYRRLAKLIHPDINKKTMDDKNLKELWTRIVRAYNASDIDELEDLEVLVRKAMEELGDDAFELNYSDVDERIKRVERQIHNIITTETYTFGELIKDEKKISKYKEKLQNEYNEYKQYLETLTKKLEELLAAEGVKTVWEMN